MLELRRGIRLRVFWLRYNLGVVLCLHRTKPDGAGYENRTRVSSLGSLHTTTVLIPRAEKDQIILNARLCGMRAMEYAVIIVLFAWRSRYAVASGYFQATSRRSLVCLRQTDEAG